MVVTTIGAVAGRQVVAQSSGTPFDVTPDNVRGRNPVEIIVDSASNQPRMTATLDIDVDERQAIQRRHRGPVRDVQRQLKQFRLELELFFASGLGFINEGGVQEAAE
jgi:hypothetical protein